MSFTRYYRYLLLIAALLAVLGLTQGAMIAQEGPTESTEAPTAAPTEAPTEMATEVPPTTEVPPVITEEPTELPTEIPTAIPTDIVTEAPPIGSFAPVFILPGDVSLNVVAGTILTFPVIVTDDEAGVVVLADTAATIGAVSLEIIPPVETVAPFTTYVNVSYVAPVGFSGGDSFTLLAVDPSAMQAALLLTVTVLPAEATVEPLPTEATPIPTAVPLVERILNYSPTASEESIAAMLAMLGAQEIERIPAIGAMLVRMPESMSTRDAAISTVQSSALAAGASLAAVEENQLRYVAGFDPNDPYIGYQWGLGSGNPDTYSGTYVWNPSFIGAWDINPARGYGITIAVIDTGVDTTHPELIGQTVAGWDFAYDDNIPDDGYGHGTAIAGIIAARTNNAIGIAGIAYRAKIMPVKVFYDNGTASLYNSVAGIIYAVDRGAQVLNLSYGACAGPSTTEQAAINYALARNVVVVSSAGNGNGQGGCVGNMYSYPASYPGVISVAAHDADGSSAGVTSGYIYNDAITVSAPGIDIPTIYPGNQYVFGDGTSFAAAHITGIAALIMSANVARTPESVREALICGAMNPNFGWSSARDDYFGWGMTQADFAMNWRINSGSCKVPQANDEFESATTIAAVPYVVTQPINTRSVTSYASDPNICGMTPYQTLWYRFTPVVSDYYQITTRGSSYDTIIGIYQGAAGQLTELACDDDSFSALQSNMLVGLTGGRTYYIAVGSFGGINDQLLRLDVRLALRANNVFAEENSVYFAYAGTWARVASAGSSGGYVMETSDNSAALSFSFRGTRLDLYRTIGPYQGNFLISVDDVLCGWVDNRAAVLSKNVMVNIYMDGCAANTNPGAWHRVVIQRDSAGVAGAITIDRIRTYDYNTNLVTLPVNVKANDNSAYLFYGGGVWYRVSSVGAYGGNISYTTDPGAYLRARFSASSVILYRSTSASYGSMDIYIDGVYHTTVDNTLPSTGGVSVPYVITGLTPTTHLIEVQNNASSVLVFDAIMPLTPASIQPGQKQNDNAAMLLYSGAWSTVADVPAFGANVHRTSDPNATLEFTFDGRGFAIGAVCQTGNAGFDVYIDGGVVPDYSFDTNFGSRAYYNISEFGGVGYQANARHTVRIEYTGTGYLELDYIKVNTHQVIAAANGRIDDRSTFFTYDYGAWYPLNNAIFAGRGTVLNNNLMWTDWDGMSVYFYMNGTGFIVYTTAGTSSGAWEVFVDGVQQTFTEYGTPTTYYDLYSYRWRPMAFGIANLPPGEHFVELRALLSGGEYVDFDGVRVFP